MWKCPQCGDISSIGLSIGNPTCSKDGCKLVPMEMQNNVMPPVSVGGRVTVGGDLSNYGKIKVFPNGELNVNKNLINTGDIIISDPEKIKELLIGAVKTSGSLAELGTNIIKTFFKTS